MRRADLAVGDEVYICLPYAGGRGWARITTLDAPPEGKQTNTVRVAFLPGFGPSWRRDDRPCSVRDIWSKRDNNASSSEHDDIDATGELEDAMIEAARPLVEDHDYSLSDLINVLDAVLFDIDPAPRNAS
jgi:hypothetical protein